jgi:hypothetical protein
MNIQDFKRVLSSFADKQEDIQFEKGSFIGTIRGKDIIGDFKQREDNLFIIEDGIEYAVREWIGLRLADLDTLAKKILELIPEERDFVQPKGAYLNDINITPDDCEIDIESVPAQMTEVLSHHVFGTTKILYLTSDAGEGKSTLINYIARQQASLFLSKQTKWLFVPIPLAGRPFLRFDDIVIASLTNKLRFRSFYYESFIELIKLGLIVPGFDGFEEMFVQGSTGEALTATGNLVSNLNSSGTILFATRKAYFENKGFSTQAKLFDSLNNTSITFEKVSIKRWDRAKFIEFANKKKLKDAEKIYELISKKIGSTDHPIITRPVLVNKLISVLCECTNQEEVIEKLTKSTSYFPNFVDTIIEREVQEKWIDTSGEPFKPLISHEQHYILLSLIAEEMWLNSVDELSDQFFDLITELFAENNNILAKTGDQIKERIKQHALIVSSSSGSKHYKFDHDEFKEFFLGIAIADKLKVHDINGVISVFKRGKLPSQTLEVVIEKMHLEGIEIQRIISELCEKLKSESIVSTIKENIAGMAIKLINNKTFIDKIEFDAFFFPANSLSGVNISNVKFYNCYFQETSLMKSKISCCVFNKCHFERLEITPAKTEISETEIIDSKITSIYNPEGEYSLYSPIQIINFLKKLGITIGEEEGIISESQEEIHSDERLILFEKVIRRFMRSTQINENILKLKLGGKYEYFMKEILPELKARGIIEEVEYIGSGSQKRFRLAAKYTEIDNSLKTCEGSYEKFILFFNKR